MTKIEEIEQRDDKDLTVGELRELARWTKIKVLSGFNGKVLCKDFNPKKHEDISCRKIISMWGEIETTKSEGFSNIARPIISVYVFGDVEYEKEKGVKKDD